MDQSLFNKRWGNLRSSIHGGDWHSARGVLYNVHAEGEWDVFEEMVAYYKAHRVGKSRAISADEITMYSLLGRGSVTYKKDYSLNLCTGIIWDHTPRNDGKDFADLIKLFRDSPSFEDWCVGRNVLVVVPAILSTNSMESLLLKAHEFEGVVTTIRLICYTPQDLLRISQFFHYAKVVCE